MITERIINQWREENEKGNGIGTEEPTGRVLDADEAVRMILDEYPTFEVIDTREDDGAQVLCKDGDAYILFLDANGMWGQSVTVE